MRGRGQQRALWTHSEGAFEWDPKVLEAFKRKLGGGSREWGEAFSLQHFILASVGRAHKEMVRWKVRTLLQLDLYHFTHCVTFGKSCHFFGFLICKTGIRLEPTLRGCCED